MNTRAPIILTAAILALAAVPHSAHACAACMGDPNSDIAGAANAAVISMLGLVGTMLGGISVCGYKLYRRSLAPLPPHVEAAGDIAPPSEGGIS